MSATSDESHYVRERAHSGPMWEPGERVLRLLLKTSGEPLMRERAYLIAAELFYGPTFPNYMTEHAALAPEDET